MERLKERVSRLKAEKTQLLDETLKLEGLNKQLVKENSALRTQADKVGPLISKNVKLENNLADLKDQIDELVEELS